MEATAKVKAVEALGKDAARAAHRLLTNCASKLLNFLAATVPPSLCVPALARFDNVLQGAFWKIARFDPAECSTNRGRRAAIKVAMPAPRGCGLLKGARLCFGRLVVLPVYLMPFCFSCVQA